MSVPQAIYGRLSEDAKLTALLASATSIYIGFAPAKAETPYVVFSLHSGNEEWAFRTFYRNQLWLVKTVCRGGDPTPAEEADARIEFLLNDAPLNIGEYLLYLRRETDVNYHEIDRGTMVSHRGGLWRLMSEPEFIPL